MNQYKYLDKINSPDDIKKLSVDELTELCSEIRTEMIDTVAINGGHLSSNLGVVEMTVALHKAFSSPHDQIIFDVGHQCYTHKLLTGRFKDFHTLRKEKGISGFPNPEESEHDCLISGHSSTSISSACGLSMAKSLLNDEGYVIAVIGDGAFSGGMAYEGLNNAGRCKKKFIVILNDNEMSISHNVGSMARYLTDIRSKKTYVKIKTKFDHLVSKIPRIGKALRLRLYIFKKYLKGFIYRDKSTFFEDMGFDYMGPVDGNDLHKMINILELAKNSNKPVLIHASTVKGKGYSFAEKSPRKFHGISGFDVETGETKSSSESFSEVFGDELCKAARENKSICAVTAAMKSGTGLTEFAHEFPDRFFDIGIAEQHAVTFCAGLARNGIKPFFAVYSSFLQRSYDQIIHDVAISHLPVVFAIDRAGVVGDDGITHNGLFDAAFLNSIPNIRVYSPAYFEELRSAVRVAANENSCAVAIRYPRGCSGEMPDILDGSMEKGFVHLQCNNADTVAVTYGRVFEQAYAAYSELKNISLIKINVISPLDDALIEAAMQYKNIYFFEEGVRCGGIGEHFFSCLTERGYKGYTRLTAADNPFISHATTASVFSKLGLDSESIKTTILKGNLCE